MLKLSTILPFLLLTLVGCSSAPRERVPDWNASDHDLPIEVEHVSDGPQIAEIPESTTQVSEAPTNLVTAETWIPIQRWSRDNNIEGWTQLPTASGEAFTFATAKGVLQLQAGSLGGNWEGAIFHLGFKPQLTDDQLYVHALDLEKNIEPFFRDFPRIEKTNRVIVIDAGHGGSNGGTVSVLDGSFEKTFTLDWALRIKPLLATNGWQVFLTRTNDLDLSLSARIAFADACNADLFVSLHFNSAAPSQTQSGLETYCLTPTGMHSTLTRGFEDNTALVFTNNAFDAANLQYSMRVHRELLKRCDFYDRGIRRARFMGVLRGQNRPAVLIEGGFLSNPEEAKRVADPEFRQQLAEAVANALK